MEAGFVNNLNTSIRLSLANSKENDKKPSGVSSSPVSKNDEFTPSKDKSKKAKIASVSIVGACLVGLLGTLLSPKFFGKRVSKFISEQTKTINSKYFNTPTSLKIKGYIDKAINLSNNSTNLKDIYIKKITSKIPFVKKFDSITAKLYKNTAVKMTNSKYAKALKKQDKADRKILKLLKKNKNQLETITILNGENTVTKTVSEWTDEIQELMKLRKKSLDGIVQGQGERFKNIESATDGIGQKVLDEISIRKIFTKDGFKKVSGGFVSEGILGQDKSKLTDDLLSKRNLITSSDTKAGYTEQINNILEAILGEKKYSKALKSQKSAGKSLDTAIKVEANDLFDKMRDIKSGCAQWDIASAVGTAGLMGVYLAQADNKEERTSVALTSGIPLMAAIGATSFATMKMVTGAKAMLVGGVTGLFANIMGRIADSVYRKKTNREDVENSIPTLGKEAQNFINAKIEKAPLFKSETTSA